MHYTSWYQNIGTHWNAISVKQWQYNIYWQFKCLYIIQKKKKKKRKFIGNWNIIANVSIIQAYDSIIREELCIGFIDFLLDKESSIVVTRLFSSCEFEEHENK